MKGQLKSSAQLQQEMKHMTVSRVGFKTKQVTVKLPCGCAVLYEIELEQNNVECCLTSSCKDLVCEKLRISLDNLVLAVVKQDSVIVEFVV